MAVIWASGSGGGAVMALIRASWVATVLGLALCVLVGVGCMTVGSGGPASVIVVTLALAQTTVKAGSPTVATATVTIDGVVSRGRIVSFTSSHPEVATVRATATTNASGVVSAPVKAVADGTTSITATYGGASDSAILTVVR